MANNMPAELLKKFAADREAKKAPSGQEISGSSATRKRAVAKARKAKESTFRNWSFLGLLIRAYKWPARPKHEKDLLKS